MPEVWELVDVNKQLTGIRHLRGQEALIPPGHYHLVARVLVMDAKGQILLTQRSHGKAHYPNIGNLAPMAQCWLAKARKWLLVASCGRRQGLRCHLTT